MKKVISLVLALSFFMTPSLFAAMKSSESGWHSDIGLEGYHYNYRETVDNQFFVNDKGPMYGLYYDLSFQPESMLARFALEMRGAWSNSIHYNSNGSGTMNDSNYEAFEARLLGFYPWNFDVCTLEGYAGLGQRFLTNDDSGKYTTVGHWGYLRKSHYNYIPLGVRLIKELNCGMNLVGHLEYDWFLSGTQKSYVENTCVGHQPRGTGARAGIDLHIPSPYAFEYKIGAFVRYWHIQDSESDGFGYEPKNKTHEVGVRIGLSF